MDDLEKEIKRTKKERIKMKKYNKKALMKLNRSKKEFTDLETVIFHRLNHLFKYLIFERKLRKKRKRWSIKF